MTTAFAMHQNAVVLEDESPWRKAVELVKDIAVPVAGTLFFGAGMILDVVLVLESIAMGGIIGWCCAIIWGALAIWMGYIIVSFWTGTLF